MRFRARRAGCRSSRTRGSRARWWAGPRIPLDGAGPFGAAFANRGTSQPKFDVRVDQELSNGGQLTYSGGVSATEGLSQTGVGPFDIQRGSYLGYGKFGYTQGDFRFQVSTNIMDGAAPNLLLPDPNNPGQPVELGFKGKTFDAEIPDQVSADNRTTAASGRIGEFLYQPGVE